MYGISGTKYFEELEKLPYFNKNTAGILLQKAGRNLDRKIERLTKSGYLMRLKNGLYITKPSFLATSDKTGYSESLASILCYPSYLSLEYVLAQAGLIPEAIQAFTSITTKSTREIKNFLGRFLYQNIDDRLFCGFTNGKASTAKALFDYLYLKSNLGTDIQAELSSGLRINWDNFSVPDYQEFEKYVAISSSQKMVKIAKIIKDLLK